jgi:hypothetical protein
VITVTSEVAARSRSVAQHELFAATRRVCPESVRALRDLATCADKGEQLRLVNDWADHWHLQVLLDLVPHVLAYWARRPAAASVLFFPRTRAMMPSPRITKRLDPVDSSLPVLAHTDYETEQAFLKRARAHYRRREEVLTLTPTHRRRTLQRHCDWYVRHHVQGWPAERIAEAEQTDQNCPDVSTITKGIQEVTRLLTM